MFDNYVKISDKKIKLKRNIKSKNIRNGCNNYFMNMEEKIEGKLLSLFVTFFYNEYLYTQL